MSALTEFANELLAAILREVDEEATQRRERELQEQGYDTARGVRYVPYVDPTVYRCTWVGDAVLDRPAEDAYRIAQQALGLEREVQERREWMARVEAAAGWD